MAARQTLAFAPNLGPPTTNGVTPSNSATAHYTNLWTNTSLVDAVFSRIDYFILVDPSAAQACHPGSANYDADWASMMSRLNTALRRHRVKFILDVGGPMGYSPSLGPAMGLGALSGPTGLSTASDQGYIGALYQNEWNIQPLIDLGFDIWAVELQSSYRRLVENGENSDPHQFYRGVGSGAAGITYTAVPVGTLGQNVRVRHVVAGTGTALSVSVSGEDVTVNVATDGSGVATSTAAQVVAAVNAHVPAQAVVTATATGGGAGVISAAEYQSLYYGDDGCNYSPAEVGTAFAVFMQTVKTILPSARFILNDSSGILGPWNGVEGYSGLALADQTPASPAAFATMLDTVSAAGESLWGYVADWGCEMVDGLITSTNSGADDWFGRTLDVLDWWRGRGVVAFHGANTTWGRWASVEAGGTFDYLNPGETQQEPLDAKFQTQMVTYAADLRAYQDATNPAQDPFDATWCLYTWFEYPEVILDNTASAVTTIPEYSFTDTFFKTKAISQPRRIDTQRRRRFGPPPRTASSTFPPDTTLAYRAENADAMPAYLTPQADSTFGTEIVRVSNIAGQRHRYSSKAAWNSDESLMLLDYPPGGSGTARAILDGTTYAVLQAANDTMGNFTWSNTDPNVAWAFSGLTIRKLAVTGGAGISVTSSTSLAASYSAIDLGGGQGSISNDDAYLAFLWKKANNDHGIGVFDTASLTVIAERTIGNSAVAVGALVDNCGMSQSGDYVIGGMQVGDGTGATYGTHVYPRDLSSDLQLSTGQAHWDVGLLADGTTDVLILASQSASGGGTGSRLGMYRLSDGFFTALIANWPNAHVSCRNTGRPGWAYASSFSYSGETFAGYHNVFAIKLDSPSTVQMFGTVHGPTTSGYVTEPQFCASPTGTRGVFASKWGGADVYPFVAGMAV